MLNSQLKIVSQMLLSNNLKLVVTVIAVGPFFMVQCPVNQNYENVLLSLPIDNPCLLVKTQQVF